MRRRALIPLLIPCWFALTASGCPKSGVTAPGGAGPPLPTSPIVAAQLLQYCWNHLDYTTYRGVLTDDFQFTFMPVDSAVNPEAPQSWGRADELALAWRLFTGNPQNPPALRIALDFGRSLVVSNDPRRGKNPRWHKVVASPTALTLTVPLEGRLQLFAADGAERLYVVRGDSAVVPQDLLQAGLQPDSTIWLVERWEDGPTPGPGGNLTWGRLKARFR